VTSPSSELERPDSRQSVQIARLPKGVTLQGKAEFVGSTTLTLDDGRRVEVRAVVIATGLHPSIPESFASIRERILTGVDAGTLLARPFYHPMLEEGLKPALRQVCERARVQLPPMQDSGSPAGA
jgi:hypothetical protein